MKDKSDHFWVAWCHLYDNPRMTSSYLVIAPGKLGVRRLMGIDHVVDKVESLVDYLRNYDDISEQNLAEALKDGVSCIEAGT